MSRLVELWTHCWITSKLWESFDSHWKEDTKNEIGSKNNSEVTTYQQDHNQQYPKRHCRSSYNIWTTARALYINGWLPPFDNNSTFECRWYETEICDDCNRQWQPNRSDVTIYCEEIKNGRNSIHNFITRHWNGQQHWHSDKSALGTDAATRRHKRCSIE